MGANIPSFCVFVPALSTPGQTRKALGLLKAEENAAKFDFIVIVQGRGRFWRQLLSIEKCEVGAVLVFKHVLAVFDKDTRVHAGDTAFFPTIWRQVHIRENVADRIFATNQDVVFAAQVELLVVGLDNQARI